MKSLRRSLGLSLALAVVVPAAGACTALLGDFNDSTSPSDASTGGDTGADGTAGDSASPDGVAPVDSGHDASPSPDGGGSDSGGDDGGDSGDAGCPASTILCNGSCVPNNASHCGSCSVTCGSNTPVCAPADGGDAYECVSGCSGTTPDLCNGTCTNTQTDPANCNGCNNVCSTQVSNATPACVSGSCTYQCDPNYTACSGGCWDTNIDLSHCGASCSLCTSAVANSVPICASGACTYQCDGFYTACGGGCWDTNTDQNHCGASCSACTGGQTCQSGACACPTGQVLCSGQCMPENLNCGTCGHSCLGGTCSAGMCEPITVASNAGGTPFWISVILENGQTPEGIAWSIQSTSGNIDYCPISGCSSGTALSGGQNFASQLGVQGIGSVSLWWADENTGTLSYTQAPNGSATYPWLTGLSNPIGVVATSSSIFVASANTVYQTTGGSQNKVAWMTGLSFAWLMSADANNLYVNDLTNHDVVFCGLSAPCIGANQILASNIVQNNDGPRGIYADGTNVWFTLTGSGSGTGAVYKCPAGVAGCNTTTPFYAPAQGAYGILSDTARQTVYWLQGGSLVSCPIAGCPGGGPTTLYSPVFSNTALAQDPQFLYVAVGSGIARLAK